MTSTAHKGRYFEQRVKELLLKKGYFVVRCAASKPCDLVAIKDGETILIECKNYAYPTQGDMRKIQVLGAEAGCQTALFWNVDGKIQWRRWE
jgi:Holliday junction resolvase